MTWRDSLQPASFRGVAFEVEGAVTKLSRRNAEHEYPQRDVGYVEDLGRGLRRLQVVGFVLGDDWRAKRDALLSALEQGGAGRLIHPTFGELLVNVDTVDVDESTENGRQVRFTIAFVDAGSLTYPTATTSSSSAVAEVADEADAATAADLEDTIETAGHPQFVADAAAASVQAAAAEMLAAINGAGAAAISDITGAKAAIASLQGDVVNLVATPADLASAILSLVGYLDSLDLLAAITSAAGVVASSSATTPAGLAAEANANAISRAFIRAALAVAARTIAATTFDNYNEAVAVRDLFGDRLSDEAEAATDAVFAALTDLRIAMIDDVDERAADLVRLQTVDVWGVSSTLELAVLHHRDGTREAEIERRNTPPHPGFVSGQVVVADA